MRIYRLLFFAAVCSLLVDGNNVWAQSFDSGGRSATNAVSAPRIVEYNLSIGYFQAAPDGVPVNVLGVNGQVPSPTLSVTQGDTLVVNVINEDPAHGHSIHWHGLAMRDNPEMDGVVGVTQCSIRPFQQMQYRFVVNDEPGTCKLTNDRNSCTCPLALQLIILTRRNSLTLLHFSFDFYFRDVSNHFTKCNFMENFRADWYHGHSGLNKIGTRGIAGMLIVNAREGEDLHSSLYDEEVSLFIQDWSHDPPYEHILKSRGGLNPPPSQSANGHVAVSKKKIKNINVRFVRMQNATIATFIHMCRLIELPLL